MTELADPKSERRRSSPPYCKNEHRSIKPDVLVVVGICTHLGCSPTFRPGARRRRTSGPTGPAASSAPATARKFDLAGRVFKGVPAPTTSRCRRTSICPTRAIVIGEDDEGDA